MKVNIFHFTVLSLALLFCTEAQAQRKKVAVVTFYVNNYLDASELGDSEDLLLKMGALAKDPNFDLVPALDKFHATFFNEYAQNFPFDLLPEEQVHNNEQYKTFESFHGEADRLIKHYVPQEGYKVLLHMPAHPKNQRDNSRMLEILKDNEVDGVMFVYLTFKYARKMIPFTAGIKAYVNIRLWNKDGKRVFAIGEHGMSKKSVAMMAGIPIIKPEQIQPLCENALEKVTKDLRKRIAKITKKAAKKL